MFTTPGQEELVISGIREIVPARSVILGSTSADETIKERWWQLAISPTRPDAEQPREGVQEERQCWAPVDDDDDDDVMEGCLVNGVVVVAFHPSLDFTPVYSHGFSPTVHRARVISNGGDGGKDLRVIKQLSVRGKGNEPDRVPEPAAEVYNRWCGGYFQTELDAARKGGKNGKPINILLKSSEFPLGFSGAKFTNSAAGNFEKGSFACSSSVMLHPAEIHYDGALSVYLLSMK